jgi:hypothetical protein
VVGTIAEAEKVWVLEAYVSERAREWRASEGRKLKDTCRVPAA